MGAETQNSERNFLILGRSNGLFYGISVVGLNNVNIANYTSPVLTTIKQPLLMIGKLATESLIALIERSCKLPVQKFFSSQLIVRKSS